MTMGHHTCTLSRLATLILGGTLLACALPVAAKDDVFQAVKDTKEVTLDPEASYLIVQTNSASSMFSFGLAFLRRAEPADVEDYTRRRAEALEKAHAKWVGKHDRWKADVAQWDGLPASARGSLKRPVEPVEPTDANLAFPALDTENVVPIGPFNRFSKADGRSTFVHRVKPGRYAFYGSLVFAQAVGGTCMCMGTFEFDVAPGQVVYAGMMADSWLAARAEAKKAGQPMPKTGFDLPADVSSLTWDLPEEGEITDPRLAGYSIVPAQLRAAGHIPNYYGVAVDRITAIPGIVTYQRDTVIDVRTGLPAGVKASGEEAAPVAD